MERDITKVFDCKMCGECCYGKGGIVVGPEEIKRICNFLGITVEEFSSIYLTEEGGGKYSLTCGEDGYCVFFEKGRGCSIHPVKPDICRAWPFFRGNMVDESSLEMAKQACPGIARDVSFQEFCLMGRIYLKDHGLIKKEKGAPNALLIKD